MKALIDAIKLIIYRLHRTMADPFGRYSELRPIDYKNDINSATDTQADDPENTNSTN
mgnify:CR=1 FL=1